MDIHFLSKETAYIDAGVNLGLICSGEKSILIDAGIEVSVAKKVLKLINEKNLKLSGLILTHAHADHTGGAAYIKNSLNIPVISSFQEKPFIEHPHLEPFYLFGGATPLKTMENKFLQAPPCSVDICLEPGKQDLLGFAVDVIPLPGHTPGQIGIAYEGTLYLADALFAPEILAKHGLPYFVDIGAVLHTLGKLSESSYDFYVPSHGSVVENPVELTLVNKKFLEELLDMVLGHLKEPHTTTELLGKILREKNITINNPSSFYLMQASLQALLSYLVNTGKINVVYCDNLLCWHRNQS
ncbi:MBL fold metallo-hydrolase [Thermanaerosceptrum fracticalcis]|uniref:MBL fold metallo-hydrolase n=1 Tax=Thermanaerosceptrum fracticalcis TaxID=1712410 RepID=A0A7G6E296_THEFR|nr:MBL fold metallo-hydrolase [Thermanaerosceptrum fracticalcis]QNB46200.1 MBL fold metallo-hydrolase [Thermanaerosceptrum fracticalcis]